MADGASRWVNDRWKCDLNSRVVVTCAIRSSRAGSKQGLQQINTSLDQTVVMSRCGFPDKWVTAEARVRTSWIPRVWWVERERRR